MLAKMMQRNDQQTIREPKYQEIKKFNFLLVHLIKQTQLQAHGKIYKEEGQIPPITSNNVEIHLNIKHISLQKSKQASQ